MKKKVPIISEKALYRPTFKFLHSKFLKSFGNCHLEITASGHFEETLKRAIQQDIIFTFLGKKASPDLAGFVEDKYGTKHFITVEIKSEKITIQDIYQAKLYGDLFSARYALLISLRPIPDEIKRLHRHLFILQRVMGNYTTYIGELLFYPFVLEEAKRGTVTGRIVQVIKEDWFPESPFVMLGVPVGGSK